MHCFPIRSLVLRGCCCSNAGGDSLACPLTTSAIRASSGPATITKLRCCRLFVLMEYYKHSFDHRGDVSSAKWTCTSMPTGCFSLCPRAIAGKFSRLKPTAAACGRYREPPPACFTPADLLRKPKQWGTWTTSMPVICPMGASSSLRPPHTRVSPAGTAKNGRAVST